MQTEYQRLTALYRQAGNVRDLEIIFKETGSRLKELIRKETPHGLSVLESYIYFYKKLAGEPFSDGKFKGRSKQDFVDAVKRKAGINPA